MNKLKKIVALIICLFIAMGSIVFAEEFQLISALSKDYEGHWAGATIQKWLNSGKVTGYPDGSYKPDNNVTRAEFVKMVNGIININLKGKVTYKDVPSTEWFYDYISIAQEIGYISGYSEDEFGPNDNITREQAASILARIQYLNENAYGVEKFNDKNNISSWAKEAVEAASEAGFIKGYDGSFRPQNYLTRAEAITMLDNVLVNAKNTIIYNSGDELKDAVIKGDLIIARTVGEGDVQLTNLEVNGDIKVYGGGTNSVYFNNVKVSQIVVEKDKIRLVFDDNSTVEEITVMNEAILENENGEIAKITILSNNEVTLSGNYAEVAVLGSGNITLDDAVIARLTVENPIVIQGTGSITALDANADGIEFEADVEIEKITLGDGVTEVPVVKEELLGGGGGSVGPSDPTPVEESYVIKISATSPDGLTKFINTDGFVGNEKVADFLVAETKKILSNTTEYEDAINENLNKVNLRLDNLTINGYKANTQPGWDEIVAYADGMYMNDGTYIYDELYNLKLAIDGEKHITDFAINDIKFILNLYESSQLEDEYIHWLNMHFTSTDPDFYIGHPELLYNGEPVQFKLTAGGVAYNGFESVINYILSNATKDINTFFKNTDTVTMEIISNFKTSSISLQKISLK